MSEFVFALSKKQEYEGKISEAVRATFENLIFSEIEKVDLEFHLDGEFLFLDILDPYRGFFLISIPKPMAAEIASTVLGIDTEMLTDSLLVDASGEVLNTVVGHFLRSLVPDGGQFNLGLPKTIEASELPVASAINMHFSLNNEVFGISLRW
jgi:CheY-specific phosphatase CheX